MLGLLPYGQIGEALVVCFKPVAAFVHENDRQGVVLPNRSSTISPVELAA
jgi:hypothetical protein